ncbi:hypothetical protein Scep_006907 [Stephania cephalantha]|uniref:Uncharacterized protein n=1 Tax=Stephania cephalantha TaxID=152367 RepID=A0AAP0PNC4_9MAGN
MGCKEMEEGKMLDWTMRIQVFSHLCSMKVSSLLFYVYVDFVEKCTILYAQESTDSQHHEILLEAI